jgi:NAD(P)-dependent dehydrogenase (short-subunit alcohol dehydrogenase family)
MTAARAGLPLAGRVGIVTGGASGIGRATAVALVHAGARVVIADLNEAGAQETIREAGNESSLAFVQTDVADPIAAERMVQFTTDQFGRLDFAHNNAGIESAGTELADVPIEEFRRVLDVNLTGVWNCMRAQIPVMLAGGGGSIINTSSGLGLVGILRQGAYVAAKHGVIGLTRAAALEYSSRGVRVNAVCPGVIETPLFSAAAEADPELRPAMERAHPIGRLGRPADVAAAVVWLASDASGFVTGHPLAVDGGYLAQ